MKLNDHDRQSCLCRQVTPNKSAPSPLLLVVDIYAVNYLLDLPETLRARCSIGWRSLTLSTPDSRTTPCQAADIHTKIKSASSPIVLIRDVSGPRALNNPQEAPVNGSGTSGHERASIPPPSLMRQGAPPLLRRRGRPFLADGGGPGVGAAWPGPPLPLRIGGGVPLCSKTSNENRFNSGEKF